MIAYIHLYISFLYHINHIYLFNDYHFHSPLSLFDNQKETFWENLSTLRWLESKFQNLHSALFQFVHHQKTFTCNNHCSLLDYKPCSSNCFIQHLLDNHIHSNFVSKAFWELVQVLYQFVLWVTCFDFRILVVCVLIGHKGSWESFESWKRIDYCFHNVLGSCFNHFDGWDT